jgi:hypothetical protein
LGSRGAGDVDVVLDREGDAVERREVATGGDHAVGRFGGFEGLLPQDDRDGVDRGVHRLDPPEVGLDDFQAGRFS